MAKKAPYTIGIDQREKLPYSFECMREAAELPYETQMQHLPTGDYVAGESGSPARQAVVERKTLADLYCTLGQHRDRFECEWERMQGYGYAALVIEAEWLEILNPNDHLRHDTGLLPKSVAATLIAWSQRYGVQVWPCPGREFAERFTFRLLERWVRDQRR